MWGQLDVFTPLTEVFRGVLDPSEELDFECFENRTLTASLAHELFPLVGVCIV